MNKKFNSLVLLTLIGLPLMQLEAQTATKQNTLANQAADKAAQVPGDIYRGTVFGAEQKTYHSDTLGERKPATKKYVYDTSLMRAVKIEDVDRVRTLLYAHVDTNERNYAGITPLTVAAEKGNLEIVKLLVESGQADVNLTSSYGITPLIAACAAGQTETVKYLIAHGADAAAKDNTGKSALQYAATANNPDLMAILCKNNPTAANVPDASGNTPLIYAAQNNFLKQARVLLNNGANPNYRNPATGLSALATAAAEGHTDMVRLLVQQGKANINLPDLNGRTPIMYAIEQNKPESVRTLLQLKADPNAADHTGATALMRASAKGNTEIMDLLLRNKNTNQQAQDLQGRDALIYSVFAPNAQAAELLVANGADINTTDKMGNTPLLAAIQAKNDKVALYFIGQNASLTHANNQGHNAFTLVSLYMPDSMTQKVLQVKQQGAYQQALQEQAAKLANVKELEQQLAQEEDQVRQLQAEQNAALESERQAQQARLQAEAQAEQARAQAQYEASLDEDPEVVALQKQMEELKARKAAAFKQNTINAAPGNVHYATEEVTTWQSESYSKR